MKKVTITETISFGPFVITKVKELYLDLTSNMVIGTVHYVTVEPVMMEEEGQQFLIQCLS